jgi:hypothetical protein
MADGWTYLLNQISQCLFLLRNVTDDAVTLQIRACLRELHDELLNLEGGSQQE